MKFRRGQEVVCIARDWVYETETVGFSFWKKQRPATGPKYMEIVTVDGYNDGSHIFLAEYSMKGYDGKSKLAFNENCFEPVGVAGGNR